MKDVSQSGWSKASVALEGREGPEQKKGGVLPKGSRALALSACSSNPFISTRRVDSFRGLLLLRPVELALLLKTCASVVLAQVGPLLINF